MVHDADGRQLQRSCKQQALTAHVRQLRRCPSMVETFLFTHATFHAAVLKGIEDIKLRNRSDTEIQVREGS
eukprot:scaffold220201_cov15-Tisochrysis_lutea.AAC.1